MRLPQVHDTVKQGLITPLIALAREKGVSAFRRRTQRWSANHYVIVYVLDGDDVLILRVIHGRQDIAALSWD